MAKTIPPEKFQETMRVPEAAYRSATAIKHNGEMTDVNVIFELQARNDQVAIYAAQCPRCNDGRINVTVLTCP